MNQSVCYIFGIKAYERYNPFTLKEELEKLALILGLEVAVSTDEGYIDEGVIGIKLSQGMEKIQAKELDLTLLTTEVDKVKALWNADWTTEINQAFGLDETQPKLYSVMNCEE